MRREQIIIIESGLAEFKNKIDLQFKNGYQINVDSIRIAMTPCDGASPDERYFCVMEKMTQIGMQNL